MFTLSRTLRVRAADARHGTVIATLPHKLLRDKSCCMGFFYPATPLEGSPGL
jgi:hypothetical protein